MEKRKWYENGFIYQIYPRSFADANGDGIGDIPGIISKLDYLHNLGVDGIWISPFFVSPLDDCGYDISDFTDIAPEYGTLADFDRLVQEAHKRNIHIILDLVVNHTSTEHRWFKAAVADPQSEYHDFYFWRKEGDFTNGNSPAEGSGYGDKVWEYLPENNEYYLRVGYKTEADLNWDNPRVREEICKVLNFWLDRGADGFRCDVIYLISKEPTLTHFGMGPRLHEYLHLLHEKCLGPHDAMTVAEVWGQTPETTLTMIGKEREELTMSFYFDHMSLGREGRFLKRPFNTEDFVAALAKWQDGINGKAVNTLVLENHDQSRIVSRFGDPDNYRYESATMLAALTFLMQGCCYIYEGQELGLVNPAFSSLDEIKDIETLDFIADMRSQGMSDEELLDLVNFGTRDVGRVPMPWKKGKENYYGFSSAGGPVKPWIWTDGINYEETNAETEETDPLSVLSFFIKLIRLKKENEVFSFGSFKLLDNKDGFFRYEREYGGKKTYVAGNFAKEEKAGDLSYIDKDKILLRNYDGYADFDPARLRPYEVIAYE